MRFFRTKLGGEHAKAGEYQKKGVGRGVDGRGVESYRMEGGEGLTTQGEGRLNGY